MIWKYRGGIMVNVSGPVVGNSSDISRAEDQIIFKTWT